MKKVHAFLVLLLFITGIVNGQSNKYKRAYALKYCQFQHTVFYATGNALIYVDRDSLIERYNFVLKSSTYYESSKEKIKNLINILSVQIKDTTNITALVTEPDVINITFSYFAECIANKKVNIVDKRINKPVKKIVVKKSQSRNSPSHSWYYYFLPEDREEFMHRVDRASAKVKFL